MAFEVCASCSGDEVQSILKELVVDSRTTRVWLSSSCTTFVVPN